MTFEPFLATINLLTVLWPFWSQKRVKMVPKWANKGSNGSFVDDFGPFLGRSKVTLVSLMDHFGLILASFWHHFGLILGSFWCRLDPILSPF